MFFNNRHSLGTPTISTEGTVIAGTERAAAVNPASAVTGATREEPVAAAPSIGAVGRARPGLLTAGFPNVPVMLNGRKCKIKVELKKQ